MSEEATDDRDPDMERMSEEATDDRDADIDELICTNNSIGNIQFH